jgi:hypothetical protein
MNNTAAKTMSRRKALALLGLASAMTYAAPVALNISAAKADDRSRTRSRSHTRSRDDD